MSARSVDIRIDTGDVLAFSADVLVLKYAQHSYGIDAAVLALLSAAGRDVHAELPPEGEATLISTVGRLGCPLALFVGVEPLYRFGYREIRAFAARALGSLASMTPGAKHVCLTLHGAGFGLDEAEAFRAEIAGVIDALGDARFPTGLERISFVERDPERAQRLRAIFQSLLPDFSIDIRETDVRGSGGSSTRAAADALRSVGDGSNKKRHVFVAMPFADEMTDIFHYGIEPAVKTVATLCERADQAVFRGEIMALLAHSTEDLKFDVKSHRCIVYNQQQPGVRGDGGSDVRLGIDSAKAPLMIPERRSPGRIPVASALRSWSSTIGS